MINELGMTVAHTSPQPVRKKMMFNCHRSIVRLVASNPIPTTSAPAAMTGFAPKRSIILPATGAHTAIPTDLINNADARAARL